MASYHAVVTKTCAIFSHKNSEQGVYDWKIVAVDIMLNMLK